MEITVNGKTYRNETTGGGGFSSKSGCDGKRTFRATIGQIEVSTLFFDVYLKHYENDVDFKTSKTGQYNISPVFGACNLDLGVNYNDKQQSNEGTNLKSGGIHTVTRIKEIDGSNNDLYYSVSGTFSCSFENSLNQLISVTGKYQATLFTFK